MTRKRLVISFHLHWECQNSHILSAPIVQRDNSYHIQNLFVLGPYATLLGRPVRFLPLSNNLKLAMYLADQRIVLHKLFSA